MSDYDVTSLTFAEEPTDAAGTQEQRILTDAAANPSDSFNAAHYGRVAAARELKRRNGEV